MSEPLKIQVIVDGSQVNAGMANVMSDVEASAGKAAEAFGELNDATEKSGYSMMEARHSIMGVGEEIGVHMPRFVSTFISHLGGIGPALAAAFAPVAIIGLIQVLSEVPAKFDEIIDKLAGWDEAARKAFDSQVALNHQIVEAAKALKLEEISNDEAGLKGSRRTQQEITDIGKRIALLKEYQAQQAAIASAAQKELDAVTVVTPAHLQGRIMILQTEVPVIKEGSDAWKEKTKTVAEATAKVAEYAAQINKLREVETPRKQATLGMEQSDAAEQAERKAEEAARKAAAVQREQILAELNDEERAAKEKIRIDEEQVKATREADKSIEKEAEEAAKKYEEAWQAAWRAVVQDQNKANKELEEANRKLQHQWNGMFAPMNHAMDQFVDSVLRGNLRIGQLFRNLGIEMLTPILSSFEKAIEAQIEYSVTSGAIGKEHALAGILRDAYKAASNVYAEVPFPFNIPAAAGMFALVAGLGEGLPSAAGGWDVPHDALAMVHKDEKILPARYSAGLDNLVNGGGGHTFNQTINVSGGGDSAASVGKAGKQMVKLAMRELRKMNR